MVSYEFVWNINVERLMEPDPKLTEITGNLLIDLIRHRIGALRTQNQAHNFHVKNILNFSSVKNAETFSKDKNILVYLFHFAPPNE